MGKFTKTTRWVYSDGGNSMALDFEPAEHIDPKFTYDLLNGQAEIVYAVQDIDPEPPYADEDGNGVEWHGFDTKEEAAHFCYQAVEEFGMGTVHRFRHDTHGPMVNNVLDPEGTCVLLLDNDWAPEGREELAQKILDEYTSYQNGDVYMIVRQWTEGPYAEKHTDTISGYTGTEYTQELVNKGGDF